MAKRERCAGCNDAGPMDYRDRASGLDGLRPQPQCADCIRAVAEAIRRPSLRRRYTHEQLAELESRYPL